MFRNLSISLVLTLASFVCLAENAATERKTISLGEEAKAVVQRGEKFITMENYQGLLYIQSMAELALASRSDDLMSDVLALVNDFQDGRRVGYGSFICYHTGGNVVPFLALKGYEVLLG